MLNGRQLRKLYQQFNVQYFGSRLPDYGIRVVPHITWLNPAGYCNRERRLIRIRADRSDEEMISVLLHEMAHAATGDTHGMPWKREMIRLREAGAPLTGIDKSVKLDNWNGIVTRRLFRGEVDDILMDIPNVTLRQAIDLVIHNIGGAPTIAEFLRLHPWAPRVFQAAKKGEPIPLSKKQRAEFKKLRQELEAKREIGANPPKISRQNDL